MLIFFGASSGKVLGNVTIKRPFPMLALICSSCENDERVNPNNSFKRNFTSYLYTLRELKGARESAVEAFA